MKKILTFLIALLGMSHASADDLIFTVDGIDYKPNYDGNTVYVSSASRDLEHVIIPSTITYKSKTYIVDMIGQRAFWDCKNLKTISISNSVTTIEDRAFADCSSLKTIKLPDTLKHIGSYSFLGCTSLTAVYLPSTVESIGGMAFKGCTSLAVIALPKTMNYIEMEAFAGCISLTSVALPETLKKWGDGIFSDCTNLKLVSFPKGISRVPDYTFNNCTSLTSITLPASVTCVGVSSFANTGIKALPFHESATGIEIDAEAFRDCDNLTSLTISDAVSSISYQAFADCDNLKYVEFTPSDKELIFPKYLETPNSSHIWYLIGYVFNGSSVSDFIIDRKLNCSMLAQTTAPLNIVFGNSITTIDKEIINSQERITNGDDMNEINWDLLTSVSIPSTVTSIATNAFLRCTYLEKINVYRSEPPTLEKYAFSSMYTAPYAELHVPKGAKQAYSEAPYWSEFTNIIDDLEVSGIEDATIVAGDTEICVYNTQGQLILRTCDPEQLHSLTPGLYIKTIGNKAQKILIK